MIKTLVTISLSLLTLSATSQTSGDSCQLLPKSIYTYIESADSNNIKLSDLLKGFTLKSSDTSYTIVSFCVGYVKEPGKYLPSYYFCCYTNDTFYIDKYQSFKQNIDGASTLFIDNVKVVKNNRCYSIKPTVYKVIK